MKSSIKNIIFTVLSVLFGLMFINAGLNKFFNYMPMPENLPEKMTKMMVAFVEIGWIIPLVAIVEIIGGILVIFSKTRALGTLVNFPIMVGIVLINIIQDSSGLPFALVFVAIFVWMMYENRAKYRAFIKYEE